MKQLSKVEIGKMRQLADFLETVPPDRFVIERWEAQEELPAKTALFGLIELQPACGFAGCAMGWAAHSKLFPGLSLGYLPEFDFPSLFYKGATDFDAAAKLLGISERSAIFFFHPDRYKGYVDPDHVAQRLLRFADKVESRLKRALYNDKMKEAYPFQDGPKLSLVA